MGGVTRGPARRSAAVAVAVAVANLLHRQHTAQAGGIFFVPRFFVLTHAVTLGDQGTGESAKPPAIVAGGYIGEEGARWWWWWWKKQKRVARDLYYYYSHLFRSPAFSASDELILGFAILYLLYMRHIEYGIWNMEYGIRNTASWNNSHLQVEGG